MLVLGGNAAQNKLEFGFGKFNDNFERMPVACVQKFLYNEAG
jgi:hypothetical protein